MWYVITGQPDYITSVLAGKGQVLESIQRPGRSAEYVLIVAAATGVSLPPTLKVNGSYESESEARVAANRFADVR